MNKELQSAIIIAASNFAVFMATEYSKQSPKQPLSLEHLIEGFDSAYDVLTSRFIEADGIN